MPVNSRCETEPKMQSAIAILERELELAREVIVMLAAELPPGRILDPRMQAALELSLTSTAPSYDVEHLRFQSSASGSTWPGVRFGQSEPDSDRANMG